MTAELMTTPAHTRLRAPQLSFMSDHCRRRRLIAGAIAVGHQERAGLLSRA
jgi:hypothetical protein